jgi:hypothetical protein
LPDKVHETHGPVQATLQQTPSEQNPLAQSAFCLHGAVADLVHEPATHPRPPVQSSSVTQWSRHAPATGSQA